MPFYVPVGPRGHIFRLGSMMIGVLGGISYWWSARRRPVPAPVILKLPER